MSSAFKENSDVSTHVSHEKSEYKSAKPMNSEGPRQALSAKPINIDSSQRFLSSQKPNLASKRLPSRESTVLDSGESKRARLLESVACDETDSDQTDEDGDEQGNGSRAPEPYTPSVARRSISRRQVLYPRPRLADMGELEVDYPSTNKEYPLLDGLDDILEGAHLSPIRLDPPRLIPEFLRDVNEKRKITLDDFSDLDVDEDSSEGL